MVLRGRYIYRMEIQVDGILVMDTRKTCAHVVLVSSQVLTALNIIVGSGKSVLWSVVTCHIPP